MAQINNTTVENPSYYLIDNLVKALKTIKSGRLLIEIQNKIAINMIATSDMDSNKIDIDMVEPDLFNLIKEGYSDTHNEKRLQGHKEDESSIDNLLNKIGGAKEFIYTIADKDSGLQLQLNLARKLAHNLTENNITIVVLRKGKEALILGKEAKPTVSKIISGSDDLQIKSVIESSKLINDINPEG